jgi:transcriptional regulator with XRE-family HTH domain
MTKKTAADIPVDIDQKLKEIGKKVRIRRKVIAKNYEDFAKAHKINKVTLLRIENGDNYTMSSFLRLLNLIGVSIEDVLK